MTATRSRAVPQRAACHDAAPSLAAGCGQTPPCRAALVAVAAGAWALGTLVALIGGLRVTLARSRQTRCLPSAAGRVASPDPARPLHHHRRRHTGLCPKRSPGLRERT